MVGAGLGGRILDDAAQSKPLAGARVHYESVVPELALRVEAACMWLEPFSQRSALESKRSHVCELLVPRHSHIFGHLCLVSRIHF